MKIQRDKLLEHFQTEMGCANCKFANQNKIGFIDACEHPLGWRSAYASMRCVRRVLIVDKNKSCDKIASNTKLEVEKNG